MFFLFLQGVPENKKIFPSYIRPYTQTRLQLKSSVKFKIVHIFGLIEWAFILSKMSVKKSLLPILMFFWDSLSDPKVYWTAGPGSWNPFT